MKKQRREVREVKDNVKQFLPGHWTFLGPGSEERRYNDSHDQQGQWDSTANKMVQQFRETGHLIFIGTSALNRHFNEESTNTELLCQTIHSTNQLSIDGAVTNWSFQFGLKDEERRTKCRSCEPNSVDHCAARSGVVGITSKSSKWKQDAEALNVSYFGKEGSNDTIM